MTAFTGEIHPAASLFPMMADTELDQLAADIKQNGLRQPLVIDGDGRLLDGRNRLRACELAGVDPEFVSVNGDDPVGLVVSLNVRRRNLTQSQRAMAAGEAASNFGQSAREAEILFGVSKSYVAQARALVERDPDAAQAVKSGTIALADAYESLRRREQETRGRKAAVDTLRVAHPDLAEQVDAETLSLRDALGAAAKREVEAEQERRSKTQILAELAGASFPVDHAPRYVEVYDSRFDPRQVVTPNALRSAAAFASAVADFMEGKPR